MLLVLLLVIIFVLLLCIFEMIALSQRLTNNTMNTEITAAEILEKLVQKIETNDVKDSVHKIKLMTARDVIRELIR